MDKIENVKDKKSFIQFLKFLAQDFEDNDIEWENLTVPAFLKSIAAWVDDYSICQFNDIDWENIDFKALARIFYMGKIYE